MTDTPKTAPAWTADTEIAFLLGLRLTGGVAAACREIGRSPQSARIRRDRFPAFAERWRAALAEKHWEKIAAEKAKRAAIAPDDAEPDDAERDRGEMPNRVRYDGWTPLRQRAFLRALAQTGKVQKACKLAGISSYSAHAMRRRYPSFAVAWDSALAKAEPTLEQVAVERAINGGAEPVYHGGQIVGHRRRYSDALKRERARLGANKTKGDLVAEAKAAARLANGHFYPQGDSATMVRSITAKIAMLLRRERDQQAEEAVLLLAAGLVP